jgi:hypothetical protein
VNNVVITKNPSIKELSGSRIEFYHPRPPASVVADVEASKYLMLAGAKANRIVIPFSVNVVGGAELDLDFKLSEELAQVGVSLTGAYWNGEAVTAYLMPLDGTDVRVDVRTPLLIGTLVQVVNYRQVSDKIIGAKSLGTSNGVMQLEVKSDKKTRRKAKPKQD